ncbi:MAG TPA: thioesterase family protein [Dehalococcoidia bacterium]|jgi:acyl-CoA thioesterase|nr:thioesterase family protein [Dehalococcoidia bacterium]
MTDFAFTRSGKQFIPTPRAGSPWGAGLVHGGPPAGLLALAIDDFAGEPDMQVARMTIDLFRQVPSKPLETAVRTLRKGRRIHVVEASVLAGGEEVTRATALLLRTSEASAPQQLAEPEPPEGPDGIEPERAGPPAAGAGRREGFYDSLEVRRVPQRTESGSQPTWVRLQGTLIEGEPYTPLSRVAATCDFLNALSGGGRRAGYPSINVDISLYLHRLPRGEWICLDLTRTLDPSGIGVVRAPLYDLDGLFGVASQAVLRNEMRG